MVSCENPRPNRPSAPPEFLAAAAVLACVGLSIIGARSALALDWIGTSEWTKPVLPTGIAFLATAVAMVAQVYQWRHLARVAFGLMLTLAGIRLTHHALGRIFIDQYPALADAFSFVHQWMAFRTAEMLVIVATGLTAYGPQWRSRFRAPVVAALASLLAIACTLQLALWMVHPGIALGWEYFTELPTLTVLAFFALSVALFSRAWRDDLQERPAGPVWIPIPIALVLMVASIVLWRSLRVEEWGHLQALTQAEVRSVQQTLAVDVRRHVHALARFARRWEAGGYADRTLWDADTALQIEQTPSIAAITWADEHLIVRWAAQRQAGKQVAGLSLLGETNRREAARAARDTRRPAITRPVHFHTDGSLGFLIMAPVYRGDRFGGIVLGAFRYRQLLEPLGHGGRGYELEITDGDTTLYRTSEALVGDHFHRAAVPLDGTTWTITAWPTPASIDREQSAFPRIVLGAGLVMALLIALAVRLAQTAAHRAHDANHLTAIAEEHARTLHAQSEQLAAARDAALGATVAKSAFLATMSHEIRTPMNGVLGTVSLLSDTTLSGEQREYADQIRLSAEHLLRLLDDILDFSKAEAGRLTLETVDLDLRALVEDAADLLAVAAQRKGLEFAVHVEPDVPNHVRGDGVRLRQVLLNLLSNAMKFTNQGTVTLTVSRERFALASSPDAARDLVRFTVTDSGIGISPSALGRLFESFSQADSSTTRRYGGSGLGLAIARQIAELMGGTVGVTSEEGRGSTFWFTARLAKSAADAAAPRAPIDRGDALTGLRVLIADDQPVSLAGLAEQMRQLGASTVECAATIGEAHARLEEAAREDQPYHVAFIDESLAFVTERHSGAIDARAFPAGTIALMTTTRSRSSAGERATTIGYRGSVTKPVRRRHLEAIVLSALGREAEVRADADAERLRHASGEAIAAAHGHGRGARAQRILVAEDNEINQKVICRMLEKLGHHVDIVVNGLDAVEACARGGYDLVLMDCQMPELDGYDATARIRQQAGQCGRVPIVALTADASVADRDRCLAAGMDDFLGKPVRPQELMRTIDRWTAHAHGIDDSRQTA